MRYSIDGFFGLAGSVPAFIATSCMTSGGFLYDFTPKSIALSTLAGVTAAIGMALGMDRLMRKSDEASQIRIWKTLTQLDQERIAVKP